MPWHIEAANDGYFVVNTKTGVRMGRNPFTTRKLAARQMRALYASESKKEHTGVMVALYVPIDVARAIAIPGGELATDLHITLVYLGDVANVDLGKLSAAVGEFSQEFGPLTGKIGGSGRFTETGGEDAVYLSFDSPDLPHFRECLVHCLTEAGIEVNSAHGFTPHITLAYIPDTVSMPEISVTPWNITFDDVLICHGDTHIPFNLSMAAKEVSAPPTAVLARGGKGGLLSAPGLAETIASVIMTKPRKKTKRSKKELIAALKHMGGQHNQKRHGWRFSSGLDSARRAMRAGVSDDVKGKIKPEDERDAYRKKIGMSEIKRSTQSIGGAVASKPKGTGGKVAKANSALRMMSSVSTIAEVRKKLDNMGVKVSGYTDDVFAQPVFKIGGKPHILHTYEDADKPWIRYYQLYEMPSEITMVARKEIDLTPPSAVRKAALHGLALRKQYGRGGLSQSEAGKQGIGSGVARAVSLSKGQAQSPDTIRRMVAFFDRHEKNKDTDPKEGNGKIAWLLWGGDAGRAWAVKMVQKLTVAKEHPSYLDAPLDEFNQTGKGLYVFKDFDGAERWVTFSSNPYQDRDKEFVSWKALEDDVLRADVDKNYGVLRWWHVPGIDIGDCDFNMMHGKILIESGTFRTAAIARTVKENADKLEISIGFTHPPEEPDSEGVFHHIRRFERSLCPKGRVSNRFTRLAVIHK